MTDIGYKVETVESIKQDGCFKDAQHVMLHQGHVSLCWTLRRVSVSDSTQCLPCLDHRLYPMSPLSGHKDVMTGPSLYENIRPNGGSRASPAL